MAKDRLSVLMLLPYLPYPLENGGRTRSFHLIKCLSERHDIYLVSFIRQSQEARYTEALQPYCREVRVFPRKKPFSLGTLVRYLFSRHSFYESLHWSTSARDFLKHLAEAEQFDVVHVECSHLGPYLEFFPPGRRFFLDQNIEYWVLERYQAVTHNPLLRLALWMDSGRLRDNEQKAWRQADCLGTVSEVDRAEVLTVVRTKSVWVIPNGAEIPTDCQAASTSPNRVLFTGNFRYFANVDAASYLCREIFPAVRRRIPEAELLIVGVDAESKLKKLVGSEGVRIIGWVPELAPYLRSASVFVCPLRSGSGTKLKVLEAMAAEKAIVSTSVGAEGLSVRDGEHMLVADDPSTFAGSVCRLLADAELRSRLGDNARELVMQQYSWKQIAGKLSEAYVAMIRSQEPGVGSQERETAIDGLRGPAKRETVSSRR